MAEEKNTPKVRRPSAKKRDLQYEKKRLSNKSYKSKVGTAQKALQQAISQKDPSLKEKLSSFFSLMDKGVKTGLFKLNKASRMKSRFTLKS